MVKEYTAYISASRDAILFTINSSEFIKINDEDIEVVDVICLKATPNSDFTTGQYYLDVNTEGFEECNINLDNIIYHN